jgi:hypothetical protein
MPRSKWNRPASAQAAVAVAETAVNSSDIAVAVVVCDSVGLHQIDPRANVSRISPLIVSRSRSVIASRSIWDQ